MVDIRRLDIYRKVPKDLTQPTVAGAVISISCVAFIFSLISIELFSFISPDVRSDLLVDESSPTDKIVVRLNISLPRMKCDFIGLDIQDDNGRHEVGLVKNTVKTPLGVDGSGCLFETNFLINQVPGNFHVSTHSADHQPSNYDFAHVIHELSLGSKMKKIARKGIGNFDALKDRQRLDANGLETHEYVMKIVPTSYVDIYGTKLVGYQYTYAYRSAVSMSHGGRIVPAIWFRYDLNPITIKYHETRPPLYHFLTTICAIVGGTFTVAGIIDSFVFSATEMIKKFELGKLN